jgi:hypothetical protein
MLLLGAAGAPLIWLGVHPVIVHNLLLIASFATAGYAMARLLRHLGAEWSGQIVGALIFGFAPYRVAHLGHLELLWTALIPMSLLAIYRALERPGAVSGFRVGTVLAMQALCSIYYFVFLLIWLVPVMLVAPRHVRTMWSRAHATTVVAAAVILIAMVWPYARVFVHTRLDLARRSPAEVRIYSAVPGDYLNVPPANRVYEASPTESEDERSLFVGWTAIVLATLALVRRPSRAVLPMALAGVVAFDLSLGVNGVSYRLATAALPPLDSFRAPARFAVFVLLTVAALAGLAMTSVSARLNGARRRVAAAALVMAALLVEYWSAPVATAAMPLRPPRVYEWLRDQPHTVTLELPAPTPDRLWHYETTFEYFSIYHWQPLANGYSGHAPRSYLRLLDRLRDFPSERSLRFLQNRRVRVILLNERLMPPGEFDRLLLSCSDKAWFAEVLVFEDPGQQRVAACRLILPERP